MSVNSHLVGRLPGPSRLSIDGFASKTLLSTTRVSEVSRRCSSQFTTYLFLYAPSDFRLYVYNTAATFMSHNRALRTEAPDGHTTTMDVIKTIQAAPGQWTITDSHLSPDNQRMIYASVVSGP